LRPGNAGGGKDPDFWCAFEDGEAKVIGESLQTPTMIQVHHPRRLPCARSQLHSRLYSYRLSERTLTARGAPITARGSIAVSTRSSNAALPYQEVAHFAGAILYHPMPPNRKAVIGGIIRKRSLPQGLRLGTQHFRRLRISANTRVADCPSTPPHPQQFQHVDPPQRISLLIRANLAPRSFLLTDG
jgi:hypothetical protein